MLDAKCQQITSFEEFRAFLELVEEVLGRQTDRTLVGFNSSSHMDGGQAELRYSATFEKGPADLRFVLVKENGAWRIREARYFSARLEAAHRARQAGGR